jgi:hypothetical protein
MPSYPEPTWTTAEDRTTALSHFYERPMSALSVTALLVRILQTHFSNASYIANANLKHLLWTPAATTRKIVIAPGFSRVPADTSSVPGIYVNRGEASFSNVGIPPHIARVGINGEMSNDNYTYMHSCEHQLICESRDGAEAEAIGEEIFRRLIGLLTIVRAEVQMSDLTVTKWSPSAKGEDGLYRSTIPVPWASWYTFNIAEETTW